jgi:hypothetical protein
MIRHRRMAHLATAVAATVCLLTALTVGCNGTGGVQPVPPRDAREAMQRIDDNLAKIEGALSCKATSSFRFRDANGTDRRYIGHPATVIFETPRCLYFDIKNALAGSVARIGSNEQRYWLWIDTPESRTLWYGTWQALEEGRARPLAIPPDQLLDALLLRPLPEELPDGLKPLLEVDDDEHRLLFVALDDEGWPHVQRELILDPRPPYMPLEIIDRVPDGRVAMHAHLSRYERVKGTGLDGPYTPRKYVIYWELDEAEMRLDLGAVRYRTKDVPFCVFPEEWEGEIEALDEPGAPEPLNPPQEGASQP